MPKSPFAEWLLTRVSSPQRASEIIGDLVEQNTSRPASQLTISGILVAFAWRWILGFALAGICASLVVVPYRLAVVPRWNLDRRESWVLWAMYLACGAVCLGTNTGLAISRYGFRDRLTWMSAALWLTLTASGLCRLDASCSLRSHPSAHYWNGCSTSIRSNQSTVCLCPRGHRRLCGHRCRVHLAGPVDFYSSHPRQ